MPRWERSAEELSRVRSALRSSASLSPFRVRLSLGWLSRCFYSYHEWSSGQWGGQEGLTNNTKGGQEGLTSNTKGGQEDYWVVKRV
jgi:hypothetical protein